MRQLSKKEQLDYNARYETEVKEAVDAWFDYWKDVSPETRKFLHAQLRGALEAKLRDEVRSLAKRKRAA